MQAETRGVRGCLTQPLVKFEACDRSDVEQQVPMLESLHTGAHCAAIPNDPVLFLSALVVVSHALTRFHLIQMPFVPCSSPSLIIWFSNSIQV